jgi:hypothetical protein
MFQGTGQESYVIREQLPFLRLQRLEFFGTSSEDELLVLRALEGISTLWHLQIALSLNRSDVHQQWIRKLEALPHLESLALSSVYIVDGEVMQDILQAPEVYI